MKKLLVLLLTIFALNSCEKDPEIIGIDANKELPKVDVCHYDADTDTWHTLSISENALKAHLDHGDVQLIDEDGDGYVTLENECFPYGDCDDTNADINPEAEEICGDGVDNNCNGEIDEECNAYTYVPDNNFEAALREYDDIHGDNLIPTDSIEGLTWLNIIGKNISDLTGIEDFTSLRTLNCQGNQLTELDLSNNLALTSLRCFSNNNLTKLDVSKNVALTHLWCYATALTELDISNNLTLLWVECFNNGITELDVSKNLALISLYCGNNQLEQLDVSNNLELAVLDCRENQLTKLDVSKNVALNVLVCYVNQLTCIKVNDENNIPTRYYKDPSAFWSEDCGY